MSTKKVIEHMLQELSTHKESDRITLLEKYVSLRLNKSLETYYKQLIESYQSLTYEKEDKVLKTLVQTNKSK